MIIQILGLSGSGKTKIGPGSLAIWAMTQNTGRL